jgi:hypothetical protein
MRKACLLGAAFVVVLAIGVGIGFAIPRPGQPPYKLRDPVPPWEDYKYPGAKIVSQCTGGGSSVQELELSGINCASMVTPDDFDKVVAFYGDRLKAEGNGSGIGNHIDVSAGPGGVIIGDSRVSLHQQGKDRPLRLTSLAVRTYPYDVVVFISRDREETETYITLYHHPNNALVKGQKSGISLPSAPTRP